VGVRDEPGGALLECAECGLVLPVTIDGFTRAMRRTGGEWRCRSCAQSSREVPVPAAEIRAEAAAWWETVSVRDRALVRLALSGEGAL
jgi:hypothetical protein